MRVADLRSRMCTNINNFFTQYQRFIKATINACYSPGILHHKIDKTKCPGYVDATEPQQFVQVFKQHTVKDIWYLGMHWNRCIRSRPLGYAVVQELVHDQPVRMLAKQDCTLELKEIYPGKQYSPTYEREPDFTQDAVTDLKPVQDDVYQILGVKKTWDGKLR